MRNSYIVLVVVVAFALAPLFVQSDVVMNSLIMILFATLLGQSWNILGGYGGQFSFGHAAFFGTGAYVSSILQTSLGLSPWLGLLASPLVSAGVGALFGLFCFRYGLKGSYFALVTLAFAEVLRIMANSVEFTGGGVGILIPLSEDPAALQFADKSGYLYLILAFVVVGFLLTLWIERSRFGARLVALRENEDAARALGVNVFRTKMMAIILSSALAGLGGSFYAQYFLYLDPHLAYGAFISVEALLVPIVGGIGTLFGPLLGAIALHLFNDGAQHIVGDAPGLSMVLYGALLILMVLFSPRGLVGLIQQLSSRIRKGVSNASRK